MSKATINETTLELARKAFSDCESSVSSNDSARAFIVSQISTTVLSKSKDLKTIANSLKKQLPELALVLDEHDAPLISEKADIKTAKAKAKADGKDAPTVFDQSKYNPFNMYKKMIQVAVLNKHDYKLSVNSGGQWVPLKSKATTEGANNSEGTNSSPDSAPLQLDSADLYDQGISILVDLLSTDNIPSIEAFKAEVVSMCNAHIDGIKLATAATK